MMKKLIWQLFLYMALSTSVNAQWMQTDGPYSPVNTNFVFSNGQQSFAKAKEGFFYTEQLNKRWELIDFIDFTCVSRRADSLFLSTASGEISIVKMSMPPVITALPSLPSSEIFALDFYNQTMLAAAAYTGYWQLSNDKKEWINICEGLPQDTIWTPSGIFYTYNAYSVLQYGDDCFVGTKTGIFRKNIAAQSWEQCYNGLSPSILKRSEQGILAVIGSKIYLSADGGTVWENIAETDTKIQDVFQHQEDLYIATEQNGILRKKKNSTDLQAMNTGLEELNINSIYACGDTLICGSEYSGFHYYADSSWHQNIQGMICSEIRAIESTKMGLVCCGIDGVYRSDDNQHWNTISPQSDFDMFRDLINNNDTLFLSVEYNSSAWPFDAPYILFSDNNGSDWQQMAQPVPFQRDDPYHILTSQSTLYCWEDEIMYRTLDCGAHWLDMSLPSTFCNNINAAIIYQDELFAAACGGAELLHYQANNNTWTLSNQALPSIEIRMLTAVETKMLLVLNNDDLYARASKEENWERTGSVPEDARCFTHIDDYLFAGTRSGIYYTSDYGASWIVVHEGLINKFINDLHISNDTLYAATYGSGVWKCPLSIFMLSINKQDQESASPLFFPNPAKDHICFCNRPEIYGQVSIYDTKGGVVLQENVSPGSTLNISQLSYGLYIVTLSNDEGKFYNKLLVN